MEGMALHRHAHMQQSGRSSVQQCGVSAKKQAHNTISDRNRVQKSMNDNDRHEQEHRGDQEADKYGTDK